MSLVEMGWDGRMVVLLSLRLWEEKAPVVVVVVAVPMVAGFSLSSSPAAAAPVRPCDADAFALARPIVPNFPNVGVKPKRCFSLVTYNCSVKTALPNTTAQKPRMARINNLVVLMPLMMISCNMRVVSCFCFVMFCSVLLGIWGLGNVVAWYDDGSLVRGGTRTRTCSLER